MIRGRSSWALFLSASTSPGPRGLKLGDPMGLFGTWVLIWSELLWAEVQSSAGFSHRRWSVGGSSGPSGDTDPACSEGDSQRGVVSAHGSAWCSQNQGEARTEENVLGRGWAIVDGWLGRGPCG